MTDPLVTGKLFGRFAQVSFLTDGEVIRLDPAIRVQFKCTRSNVSAFPSGLDLTVSNLSAQTRNQIMTKGALVALDAGYTSAHGVVYSGDIRTVDHVKHGPEWNTVIKCGTSERAWQYGSPQPPISFKKQVSKLTIIKALLDGMVAQDSGFNYLSANGLAALVPPFQVQRGIDKFNNPKYVTAQENYVHGYSYQGNAGKEIVRIAASLGYAFWIDNGEAIFAYTEQGVANQELMYVLNPETGLLGSPEHGSPNAVGAKIGIVKAKTLMIPQLRPGFYIQLQHDKQKDGSWKSDGLYHIQKIVIEGDSAGNHWECDLELKPKGIP